MAEEHKRGGLPPVTPWPDFPVDDNPRPPPTPIPVDPVTIDPRIPPGPPNIDKPDFPPAPTPGPSDDGGGLLANIERVREFIEALKRIDWGYALVVFVLGVLALIVVSVVVWSCCTTLLTVGLRGIGKSVRNSVRHAIHGRKRRRVHVNGQWRDYFDDDSSETLESGSFADPRQYDSS